VYADTPPISSNVTLPGPGTATLNATGTNISWYDVPTGGVALGTGPSFNTPFVNTQTVFYCESSESFGGGISPVGLQYATNTYSPNTTNAVTYFDVLQNCTLNSVKVYTDLGGVRLIELRDNANTLINSAYVNILPDTQVVSLNFPLTPGTQYTLGTDAATNLAIPGWGQSSPRLKRNNTGVAYPYTINNVLTITGNNQGPQYFYYFYDWQIQKQLTTCTSDRTADTVFIALGINEQVKEGIRIFPNPVNDLLNIQLDNASETTVAIYDATGRLMNTEVFNAMNNTMDISRLAPGVYQLKLDRNDSRFIYRFVVQ
jgi:hypothetical protein